MDMLEDVALEIKTSCIQKLENTCYIIQHDKVKGDFTEYSKIMACHGLVRKTKLLLI